MVLLEDFSFSCRKISSGNPFIREMLIPFDNSGYVALFEIEDKNTVTIFAIRHQREKEYHYPLGKKEAVRYILGLDTINLTPFQSKDGNNREYGTN